jgi:hypothetical protein
MSRRILTFSLFEAARTAGLTKKQEQFLNKFTKGTWSMNSQTGLVDVDGDFDCDDQGLSDFKGVRFGKVSGDFGCEENRLTSLEGAPQEVGRAFCCTNNQLTTLVGAPREVGEDFYCYNNQLTTLEGAPQEVGGDFSCDAFTLESGEWNLEGWLSVLKEGSPEAQQLIATILSPEDLNREIQKDPAGMIMKLKGVWNDESFRETRDKLVWPKGYEEEAGLVGDLDDVGF